MHILDLIMYIVCCFLLWKLIEKMTDGELTKELGAIGGALIIAAFTIIYVILFWICDYNWIDIFPNIKNSIIKWCSNIKL